MRYLALSIAVSLLSGLVAPALHRRPATDPKGEAGRGAWVGLRHPTYMLQLPPTPRAALPKTVLTENGIPVSNLATSRPPEEARAARTSSATRSLLRPQVKAVVSATITGFPPATTTYATPALNVKASENFEWPWMDSQQVTIFAIVAVLAVMTFALLTRFDHRH